MLFLMNRLIVAALLAFSSLTQLSAVSVESAYTRYYEDGEIRPIGQYFGAKLIGQRFRTVVASQPDAPAGHYFIAEVKGLKSAGAASARITYYPSSEKRSGIHTWDLTKAPLKKWLYLGLTGSDWPSPEVTALAWKLELLDSAGNVLSEWKSFLWEMP
jgi:hypothetical protein